MRHDIGGLVGSLYDFFDLVGQKLFAALIGFRRASRPVLESSRVFFGGLSAGLLTGFLTAMVAGVLGAGSRFPSIVLLGLAFGGGGGAVLSVILLFYVWIVDESVRAEVRRNAERERAERAAERMERLREKHYEQLLKKGVDPETARDRAMRGGCFIATACYGSTSAPQVRLLRLWRDRWLLRVRGGGYAVRAYYAVSPLLALLIRQNSSIRRCSIWMLDRLCVRLIERLDEGRERPSGGVAHAVRYESGNRLE